MNTKNRRVEDHSMVVGGHVPCLDVSLKNLLESTDRSIGYKALPEVLSNNTSDAGSHDGICQNVLRYADEGCATH